uniref:ADP-dependent glucokinase n=1 Tax=Steinernema glaseri TaxID=37863 RepID=A0A1I7YMB6_9BILA
MISPTDPRNRLLLWAFVFAAVPYLYSIFNEDKRLASMTVEQAMQESWDKMIVLPSMLFRKVVVGINCNVDVIVSGTGLYNEINPSLSKCSDHEVLKSTEDMREAFMEWFSRGTVTERHMASEETFASVIKTIETSQQPKHYHIGGNAALMAQRIAYSFPRTTAFLVGPIGPRSQALLHPSIVQNNSTRILKDELHVIMEYKQGEILGEYVAPTSSRFVFSHDKFSGSSVVIEMFFKAISQFRPDLVILSGIHLLEFQNTEMRLEKIRLIKRSLLQINNGIPIHLQLGNLGDPVFALDLLDRIVGNVDSIGLNEQELTFLSNVGNGPYNDEYPVSGGSLHVYKVVEMLHWLISKYGQDRSNAESKNYNYRLQRIHFHCLTYHLIVSRGTDWSNLAAGLAAGARVAGRHSCNIPQSETLDSGLLEVRSGSTYLLDKTMKKTYVFDPHRPVASWMRGEVVFIYTPVLVCKFPTKTVGLDETISTTGLLYSQFYRIDPVRMHL